MLLLSIRPKFANAILDGSKTVEFRRRAPRQVVLGSELVIYESSPTCALVGLATIEGLIECSPSQLWRKCKEIGGIEYEGFCEYFANADRAVGIILGSARRLSTQVDLEALRVYWPGFHPPQQFVYINDERRSQIRNMGAA